MSKDNGGPAFPELYISSPEPGDYRTMAEGGMSLRDYFAAKALQGLCVNFPTVSDSEINIKALAQWSYQYADAMIEAREL